MRKTIMIVDYMVDSGFGRVNATFDSGKSYDEIKSKSFDTIADALAWVAKATEEDTPMNAHVAEPFREILNNYSV